MSADRTRNAIIARQNREAATTWESRCNALEIKFRTLKIEAEHLRAEITRLRERLEAYNRPGLTDDDE